MTAEEAVAQALVYLDGVRSARQSADAVRDAAVLIEHLRRMGLVVRPLRPEPDRALEPPKERKPPLRRSRLPKASAPVAPRPPLVSRDGVPILLLIGRGLTARQIVDARRSLRLSNTALAHEAGISSYHVRKSQVAGAGVSTTTLDAIEAALVRMGAKIERP